MLLKTQKNKNDLVIIREDSLPDNYKYTDEGCDVSPSCLNCKLSFCKYDDKNNNKKYNMIQRNKEIILMRKQGQSIEEIASLYKLSTRTVRRVLKMDLSNMNVAHKVYDTQNIIKKIIKRRKPLPSIKY